MIRHIDFEKNKPEELNMQDSIQQNMSSLQNVPYANKQQDPVRKNKDDVSDPLKMREQLCTEYDKAVNEYGQQQDKKNNEGSVAGNISGEVISYDQVVGYLSEFPELDVSKDEVLVKNYSLLTDAKKMVIRMQSITQLLTGNMAEPGVKEEYRKLLLITDYADARFSCIGNALFGKLRQEDLEFIENAPDQETVLTKKIPGVSDEEAKRDLKELYENLKKSKDLLGQIKEADHGLQDDTGVNDNEVQEDLDKSFYLEKEESDDEEIDSGINKDEEGGLQNEQINRFEKDRLDKDRLYVTQNFAYQSLLNNRRKGNKDDGAEMKAVKRALKELQNAAISEQKNAGQLGRIYDRVILSLEEYVRTHDVFYKAVLSEGSERLTLVKDALYRARLEKRQLWALHSQKGNEGGDPGRVLKEEGDSRDIYAKMTRGIDALLAVERGFNATFVNGRNKKLYKKDRISALSKLFYQADRLAEADRDKYALFGGSGGIAAHMLRTVIDGDMLRDFYAEKDKMTMRLSAKYNEYRRHPVPVEFLKDKNEDPWKQSVRDQYALLRVMHDDCYRQLAGFEKMETCLSLSDDKQYSEQVIARMGIKRSADRIGAQRAVNDVLKNYKRSRQNSFVPDEKNILVQGESLFTELNKLTGPGSQNMASRFSELDPAQVYLTRFSETNETKKSMKIYGLTDRQTGEEAANDLHAEFISMNAQYVDVKQHDASLGKVFEQEYRLKKGAGKTNRRLAQAGISPGNTMKKRSLLTGYMANLLNMGELVSQDAYGEKKKGDKSVLGIYKQAPLGKTMDELTGYVMKTGLNAQMAKLVFLNIICGQMSLDSTMLTAVTGKLSDGSNNFTIDKIRLDKYTEYSFGKLSGEKLLSRYKNGRHAKLLDKLDDATKNAILGLNPILLEQYFGLYLNREEMDALQDRVKTVQNYLNTPKIQEDEGKNKDTYEPKREYIAEYEELNYERVKYYLALPEEEKAKRRAENICSRNSHRHIALPYMDTITNRVIERLSKETGLDEKKLMKIFSEKLRNGSLQVSGGLIGNRFANNIVMLLNQDMVDDEELYLIMKGLYSEQLSEYTHLNKDETKKEFDQAISKVKDIMLSRLGRLIEKYGELPALLNPEDFWVMADGAEFSCMICFIQDLNQLTDEVKGGKIFDQNDPRDAKLMEMQGYCNALINILHIYDEYHINTKQNQDISRGPYNKELKLKPEEPEDLGDRFEGIRDDFKKLVECARKLKMGPALTKEEYESYITGCEKRFASRPLARNYLLHQKEVFKDHVFVKKEKKAAEDDSDYEAQVEELRKQKNTGVSVAGLKMRERYLKELSDINREENEFLAEHHITPNDYIGAFDTRCPRLFLESYEKDENGNPKDAHAAKIHERNRDFLTALFTGDKEKLRPHLDRILSKLLSYDISIEHLKDEEWVLKHPEIFRIMNAFTYMNSASSDDEEYAWYFDELAPEVRALFFSRMQYVMELGALLTSYRLSPVMGFSIDDSFKIWKGVDAENNCMKKEDAIAEYNNEINTLMQNLKDSNDENHLTDYELIKHRPTERGSNNENSQPEAVTAIQRINAEHLNTRKKDERRIARLENFYKKYSAQFPKKTTTFNSASVIRFIDRKIAKNQTQEETERILAENWKELTGDKQEIVREVKTESIKNSTGDISDRSNARISLLREDEKNIKLFGEACMKLPEDIRLGKETELENFYSFFLSNLIFMNENAAADNLVYVITAYYGAESEKRTALDVVTQNILAIAGDRNVFDEKKLRGKWGAVMEKMSVSYAAMLEKNKDYVEYLKNKKDPGTEKTCFDKVCDAMNIIRACGAYAKIYNTLMRDPVFSSSDGEFLSQPAKPFDTYEILRAKSGMAKLDELGEQIRKGEYKKINIDEYELLKNEEKDLDDFCSKFSESAGNSSGAIQDIREGLSEKIDNITDPDKKVLELTKLLSSLDTMKKELGWEEDESLIREIKSIAEKDPEKIKPAVQKLVKELSDDLKKDHERMLNLGVPEFLADPEFKGNKEEQKKSAAMLMLTTTTPYRLLNGLHKLRTLLNIEAQYGNMRIYNEALQRSEQGDEYVGLSEAGIFEVRDMERRVNRRVSKAFLTKYTKAENAGYMERNPITREEIDSWIKAQPGQEERAGKEEKKPLDPKALEEINKILPQLNRDYSRNIAAGPAAVMEKMKKDNNERKNGEAAFFKKWQKGTYSDHKIDSRDYVYYGTYLDGGSMEVLLSDEPQARAYYVDQYVRIAMNLDMSWENHNVDWLVSHHDDICYLFGMGTYFQNMMADNPEYFESMPKALLDILNTKMYMLGLLFGTFSSSLMAKYDIDLDSMKYCKEEDISGNESYVKVMDEMVAARKVKYDKARKNLLWQCRNYSMENFEGKDKYSNLRKEISSFAYSVKPLTMDAFRKHDQAAGLTRSNGERHKKAISKALGGQQKLTDAAKALIPQTVSDSLSVSEYDCLCAMYPLIVGQFDLEEKDLEISAKKEFEKLSMRLAGMEGAPSEEEAAEQKKAALDTMAEYIMLYSLDDPGIVETDEAIAENAEKLETLSAAIKSFRDLTSKNQEWVEEKKNKMTSSGRNEGELLDQQLSVLEAVGDQYAARKKVIYSQG